MKNVVKLFLSIVLLLFLNSCKEATDTEKKSIIKETTQKVEKTKNEVNPKDSVKLKLPIDYKSQLRPNQKIEIKKIYADTLNYLGHEDGGDYGLFYAEKNNKNITLVHNTDSIYSFVKGDKFIVNWKADQNNTCWR